MIALFFLALAEASDAFAVSLAQGATARHRPRDALRVAGAFGLAQGVMPLLGWGASKALGAWFDAYDHWIAFGLLGVLGAKMIHEGLQADEGGSREPFGPGALFVAAIATSIDAAAAGVALPALGLPIALSCVVIGVVTFAVCFAGVLVAGRIGTAFGKRAEIAGGLMLIGIGISLIVRG